MSWLFLGRGFGSAGALAARDGALPALAIDLERCIGCRACEVHCQVEHDLPASVRLMHVRPHPEDPLPGIPIFPLACAHCAEPACQAVCPSAAIRRRPDGLVLLDPAACIGCRFCIIACPYGAPQWDPERSRVIKCDLCVDRLAQGLWPACATKCAMKAIHFLDAERLGRILAETGRRGGGALVLGVGAAEALR